MRYCQISNDILDIRDYLAYYYTRNYSVLLCKTTAVLRLVVMAEE